MPDPEIHRWHRLSETLTTSGQPTEEQLTALAELGTRHIVNLALHTHERALPDEAASVAALGMTYTHIPVAFDDPTEADFARFCDVMEALGNAPVHVHCIVNARVSAFLYRYRHDRLRWDEAAARADLETLWQPGGVWAAFIGDTDRVDQPHGPPRTAS